MSSATEPRFIAFDGPDGSGKTTQVKLLADYLSETREVVTFDHPDKIGLGAEIRRMKFTEKKTFSILAELFLHAADFVEMCATRIKPALLEGKTVICHRWWTSALVYQGYIDGLPTSDIYRLYADTLEFMRWSPAPADSVFACGTRPDALILLEASPETALARISQRAEIEAVRYEHEVAITKACMAFEQFRFHHTKPVDPVVEGRLTRTAGMLARDLLVLSTDHDTPEDTHQNIRSALKLAGPADGR